MARQECNNTFSDGLMMDLNPINTPKSVLTDCLNGTYITYNGNEFVLQNDMGNYKLKNCKLPTNFIPVGVKGYGDILYIVSYNPITKETEIGSYPAPQSIFTTQDTPNKEAPIEELAPFNWPNENITSSTVKYPDIIKSDKKPLFIFANSDEENYKLNPGDEFRLDGLSDDSGLEYIYQHLNFYVIDEDNKLYDLDDNDIYNYDGPYLDNNFRKVFWETPGWLAAQYDLYVPDKFNLNLKSLNVPEFLITSENGTSSQAEDWENSDPPSGQFKASMDLSSQIVITNLLFQEELNKPEHISENHFAHLFVRYKVETTSGDFKGFITDADIQATNNGDGSYDIPCKWHNYQDDIITAYVNCSPVWWMNNPTDLENLSAYDGVIAITAYPIIKYSGKVLEFTQFETKLRFPLNTLKDSSKINIANSIYKWSVDDDSCTVSFNIDGPFINASDITGRYEIYRINLFDWTTGKPSQPIENGKYKSDPISKSNFEVQALSEGEKAYYLKEKDNEGNPLPIPERKEIITWDYTNFIADSDTSKLLMCEGDISNLVLYGQNTLNIDWRSSNEYKLNNYQNWYTNPDWDFSDNADNTGKEIIISDSNYPLDEDGNPTGSKTIDFSKEGGIYIFRVILEQNGSTLNTTDKILIPSEVFNEWFGSIDNYLDETNGVTSSMWIGKWLDYKIISNILVSNFNVVNTSNDIFVEYKLASESQWNSLIYDEDFYNNLSKIFPQGDYPSKNTLFSQSEYNTLQIRINLAQLITSDVTVQTIDNELKGNLWNSISQQELSFNSNSTEVFKYSNKIDFSNSYLIWNFNWTSQPVKAYMPKGDIKYLFEDLGKDSKPAIKFSFVDNQGRPQKNRVSFLARVYRGSCNGWTAEGTQSTLVGGGYDIEGANGKSNDFYGTDRDFFQDANAALDQLNVPAALLRIEVTGRNTGAGSNYQKTISKGAWRGINAIKRADNEWVSGYSNGTFLLLRSLNESANRYGTVALYYPGGIETLYDNILSHITVQEYSSTLSTYYYISINKTSETTSIAYTINKYSYDVLLQYLRVDDLFIYSPNTSELNELQKLGFQSIFNSNISIQPLLQKTNLPLSPTLNFDFDGLSIDNITNINNNLTQYTTAFNKQTTNDVSELTTESNGGIAFDTDIENQDISNFLEKIKTTRSGQKQSKTVIWYNNSTSSTIFGTNAEDINSNSPTNNTGGITFSYFEQYS